MDIDMEGHTCIFGETQQGKTVLANKLFDMTGGLYIDIEDMGDIDAERTLTRRNSRAQFMKVLKTFNKVKYVPSPIKEKSTKEILWIWQRLVELNKSIYVYADEIQNWGTPKKNTCDVYAVRGLKHGVHLVSITQRVANVSKTIATQSPTHVFFDMSEMEERYFRNANLPYDQIKEKMEGAPKYHFVVYSRVTKLVSKPYKLKGIR